MGHRAKKHRAEVNSLKRRLQRKGVESLKNRLQTLISLRAARRLLGQSFEYITVAIQAREELIAEKLGEPE